MLLSLQTFYLLGVGKNYSILEIQFREKQNNLYGYI
jgi:hypothetical protein